jgi:hypothetical protein
MTSEVGLPSCAGSATGWVNAHWCAGLGPMSDVPATIAAMSHHCWHTLLTDVGAGAESVGVLLVVFDLQDVRKTAEAVMLMPVGRSLATPYAVGELSPAEPNQAEAQAMKNELIDSLRGPTREEVQSIGEQGADVRVKIAASLTNGLGRRWAALVLLLAGITCGMVANLI